MRLFGGNIGGLMIHERAERAARINVCERNVRNRACLFIQRIEMVLHLRREKEHYNMVFARMGSILVVRHSGVAAMHHVSLQRQRRHIRVGAITSGSITTSSTSMREYTSIHYPLPLLPSLLLSTLIRLYIEWIVVQNISSERILDVFSRTSHLPLISTLFTIPLVVQSRKIMSVEKDLLCVEMKEVQKSGRLF